MRNKKHKATVISLIAVTTIFSVVVLFKFTHRENKGEEVVKVYKPVSEQDMALIRATIEATQKAQRNKGNSTINGNNGNASSNSHSFTEAVEKIVNEPIPKKTHITDKLVEKQQEQPVQAQQELTWEQKLELVEKRKTELAREREHNHIITLPGGIKVNVSNTMVTPDMIGGNAHVFTSSTDAAKALELQNKPQIQPVIDKLKSVETRKPKPSTNE